MRDKWRQVNGRALATPFLRVEAALRGEGRDYMNVTGRFLALANPNAREVAGFTEFTF